MPKEGYDETAAIPKCPAPAVEEAVSAAVAQGILWLTNGPASLCGETVPPGVLTPGAVLQAPPDPVAVSDLTAEAVPEAWRDGASTALGISAALSHKFGKPLPWPAVRDALDAGVRGRWIALADQRAPWPCEFAEAGKVFFRAPEPAPVTRREPEPDNPDPGALAAEATLSADGIQDLADQVPALLKAAVGHGLEFRVRIELGGDPPPAPDALARINALLAKASEGWKLK